MKRHYSRTYRLGRISVSILLDEIIILYKGKDEVTVRKMNSAWLFRFKKPLLASVVFALMLVAYSLISGPAPVDHSPELLTDDDKKIQLLTSKTTDYTDPSGEDGAVNIREHVVREGDSIAKIAKEYGVSMESITGSNSLTSYELIHVGMKLKVPSRDGLVYRLKSGDQVVEVVKRYRVSLDKVLAANSMRNPDFFNAGHEIFIPDAKPLNVFNGFLWPVSERQITSGYGWRRHPIFGGSDFHKGIDLGCSYRWVKASKYGKVTYAGWLGGYGNTVILSHPGNWKTLYGHLSRISVRTGQYVKQGQAIAKSGNTGNSTGPHLHFEIISNGSHKNPYRLLKAK